MRAGIDEAGRGPVFGPIVVAGVAVEDDAPLRELGVKDSKKLTPAARETLAPRIKRISKWHVVVLHAEELNVRMARQTLNDIEVDAFGDVARRIGAADYFLDAADTDEERFGRQVALRAEMPTERFVSKHKGDDLFPVCSAASILAKVTRDREVRHLERVLQSELAMPLGSGYPTDPLTITFLTEYAKRFGHLPVNTRKHWSTADGVMEAAGLRGNKKLDLFTR